MIDYTYILGIKIDKISPKKTIEKIKDFLKEDRFHYVTTVNPEFLVEAQNDREFSKILKASDLSLADGTGLIFAAWLFGGRIYRVPGSDLTKDILNIAEQKKYSVYFFIWKQGLSSVQDVKTSVALKKWEKKNTNQPEGKTETKLLRIDGQAVEKDGSDINWDDVRKFKPDILLVGLGAPQQEKLIYKIKIALDNTKTKDLDSQNFTSVKVAIGIGGSLDFLTEKVKRAPKFMRKLGLEWLYRMLKPGKPPHNYFYRIKRVLTAVIIFPLFVIKWRLRMVFCYRKGVLLAVINKDNKILICEGIHEQDNWQFPQGGIEKNETPEETVTRELYEETGIKHFEIIKQLDQKHKYNFRQPRHIRRLVKSKYGYKGQEHYLFLLKLTGDMDEIKLGREFVSYKWVLKDDLLEKLHPDRKEVGKMILEGLNRLEVFKN